MSLIARPATNIVREIEDLLDPPGTPPRWRVRTFFRPDDRFDLLLLPRTRAWEHDRRIRADLDRLEDDPRVRGLERRPDAVAVRLDDAPIAALGDAYEEGGVPRCDDLAAGRTYMVQFCEPNASKPLHVGHLRNVALGNALLHVLAAAGAQVEGRSNLADYGRNIAEAMAGVVLSGADGQAPPPDEKADHFIGRCYASYVAANPGPAASAVARVNAPLRREAVHAGDLADRLLASLVGEEPDAVRLWREVRDHIVRGHQATLDRLGVHIDLTEMESDHVPLARELARRGVESGVLQRNDDGSVVYATGREEYDALPLLRNDGVPTHHLRTLAYWVWAEPQLDDVTSVQLCGTEWQAHTVLVDEILERLSGRPQAALHPSANVLHGMVTADKRIVSSSDGTSLRIDDLLDYVVEGLERRPRAAAAMEAHATRDELAAHVALAYFLPRPAGTDVEFALPKLFSTQESLGWAVQTARGQQPTATATGDGVDDPAYRFAILHAQHHWYHMRACRDTFDVVPLARHLGHFARWYISAPRSPHVARVAHAVIDHACDALGLCGSRSAG